MTTLKQLAKLLNVSVSTVSKALSDADDIGEETKKRVKELAETLNYKPNKLALGLKSNVTNTLGVVIPDILNPFFAEVLYGIQKQANKRGYDTLVCLSNESTQTEINAIQLLKQGRIDGFIISPAAESQQTNNFSHIEAAKNERIKFVMFDRVDNQIETDKVSIDDQLTVYNATEWLIKKGKTRIAYVSNIENLNIGNDRKNGYREALKNNNLAFHKNLELEWSDIATSHQKLAQFIKEEKFDAVISADNSSAIMIQSIVKTILPELFNQITCIGFANAKTAMLTYPPLNYIEQNAAQMGEKAVDLIIERIKDKSDNPVYKQVKIPTHIVEA
jgi:LacI family transcriptional regulator